MNNNIFQSICKFIQDYVEMEVGGVVINCPYWMNKVISGKVTLRGFLNGKGDAESIRKELIRRLNNSPSDSVFPINPENLRKFARRERIGIDCSGFVYRVLDQLLRLGYGNTGYKSLDQVFNGGITKTNAKRLTSIQYCTEITNIKDIKLGDMIRLWNGKHIAIVLKRGGNEILYAHSSSLSTKIQGVHTSIIQIIEVNKSLEDQQWVEETRTGKNFGKKYFHRESGDGVFRLKIFEK